jgi:hypothetical protein
MRCSRITRHYNVRYIVCPTVAGVSRVKWTTYTKSYDYRLNLLRTNQKQNVMIILSVHVLDSS